MSSHEAVDMVQERHSSKHMLQERKLAERQIAEHVAMNSVRGYKEIPHENSLERRQAMIAFEYEIINGEMCANGVPIKELLNPPEDRKSNFPKLDKDVIDQLLKVQDVFANNPNAEQALVASNRGMYPGSDRNYLYQYKRSATNPNLIECVAIEHPGSAEEFRKFQEALLKMANNQIPGNNNGLDPAAILEKGNEIDGDTIYRLADASTKNNPNRDEINSYLKELRDNMTNLDRIRHEEQELIQKLADVIEQAIINYGEKGLETIISRLEEEFNEKGSPLRETIDRIFESTKIELANIAAEAVQSNVEQRLLNPEVVVQTSTESSVLLSEEKQEEKRKTEQVDQKPFTTEPPLEIKVTAEVSESLNPINNQEIKERLIDERLILEKDLEQKPIEQSNTSREEQAAHEAQIQRDREIIEQASETPVLQSSQTEVSTKSEYLNIEEAKALHPHELIQANLDLIKPKLEQAVERLESTSNEIKSFKFDQTFYDTLLKSEGVFNEQVRTSSPNITYTSSPEVKPQATPRRKQSSAKKNLDFVLKSRKKTTTKTKSKSKEKNVKRVTLVQGVVEQAKKSIPVRVVALVFYALPLGVRSVLYKASRPLVATVRTLSKVAKNTTSSIVKLTKSLLSAPKALFKAAIKLIKNLTPKKILAAITKTVLLLRSSVQAVLRNIREGIKALTKAIRSRVKALAQKVRQIVNRTIRAITRIFKSIAEVLKNLIFRNKSRAKKAKSRRRIIELVFEPIKVTAYLLVSILTYPLKLLFGRRFKSKKEIQKDKRNKKLKRQELYDQLLMLLMKRAYINAKNADEARKHMLKEKLKRLLFLSKEELEEFIEMAALNEKEKHLLIEVLQMYNREIPEKYLAA